MVIRPIASEEYELSRRVESMAFNMGLDTAELPEDASEQLKYRHAVFDGDMLCSCIDLYPLRVVMNGHNAGMTGVGTVSTLPEKRRSGYIRALMKYSLGIAHERGDAFAFLYPFSNVYYRQFGYEPCMTRSIVTYPLNGLSQFKQQGSMEMYLPGGDYAAIEKVYNEFAADKNFMVMRDAELWRLKLDKEPFKNCRYVYLHRDGDGKPDGYLIFSRKPGSDMDTVIEEAPYLSYDALRSMFAFLSTYSGNSRSAVLTAPLTMRPELFFTEPNDISSRAAFDGMARIVDAVAALETLNMHEGETITIEITDEFLPWNDGVFRVTSHEGKTLAARSDSPADLSCGVGALTQLVSGFASLDESAALGKAEVLSNSVLLREVFSKKDLFIANYF